MNNEFTKIKLKNGFLIYPEDWTILNIEDASESYLAYAIECKNAEKYNVPILIYFTNIPFNLFDSNMCTEIYERRIHIYPNFRKILDNMVPLIPDKNHLGHYINADEHLKAPQIGIFPIHRNVDTVKNYPYGAKILVNEHCVKIKK